MNTHRNEIDLERIKSIEKKYHEQQYAIRFILPADVSEIRRQRLRPCYAGGSDRYSDNIMAFHELMLRYGGWTDKIVLDYACGNGSWVMYWALTGAKRVIGFDFAETGIHRGMQHVIAHDASDKVQLVCMDATKLGFQDEYFDIVIGGAALHHVIKYPGIFEELHRVMKSGARAYFLEGLADFPLLKLWWRIRGTVKSGDVPIFAKEIRKAAHMFSNVEIIGDTFLFSMKSILARRPPGRFARVILRVLKNLDNVLFKLCPSLRAWGSFSYIVLTK